MVIIINLLIVSDSNDEGLNRKEQGAIVADSQGCRWKVSNKEQVFGRRQLCSDFFSRRYKKQGCDCLQNDFQKASHWQN